MCRHEVQRKQVLRKDGEQGRKMEGERTSVSERCLGGNQGLRVRRKNRRKHIELVRAVSIHLWDKNSSYMICFPSLQMKASALALQSDQLQLSPLLLLVRLILSAAQLNDVHTAWHCGANNGTSLCAEMADPASAVSCSHNHIDKISKSTFNPLSPFFFSFHELHVCLCSSMTFLFCIFALTTTMFCI